MFLKWCFLLGLILCEAVFVSATVYGNGSKVIIRKRARENHGQNTNHWSGQTATWTLCHGGKMVNIIILDYIISPPGLIPNYIVSPEKNYN